MSLLRKLSVVSVLGMIVITLGCEWEDSDSFNTSKNAGADINYSGYYTPESGDYIAGTNITSLVISQTGNRLDITDNNGVTYEGSVGAPGIQSSPSAEGVYPAGATMLQSQIHFASYGATDADDDDVEFVGIINVVTVEETTASETTLDIDEGELTKSTTRTFAISEANSRYRLQGNWLVDGEVLAFRAWAPASAGSFDLSATGNNSEEL